MDNYRYCVEWVLERSNGPEFTSLDFGCGAGQIVQALQEEGVAAFGCDVFYEGGDYLPSVNPTLLETAVRRMDSNRIPFGDDTFDVVTSNMVLEHVADLDFALSEISRVLKPGGLMMSLFPDRGVIREGHCGIPALHWFPKGSRARVHYARACRSVGLGYFKEQHETNQEWAEHYCQWLDDWTYYRSRRTIENSLDRYFDNVSHIENDYLTARLRGRRELLSVLPDSLGALVVRKLACLVVVAQKARAASIAT